MIDDGWTLDEALDIVAGIVKDVKPDGPVSIERTGEILHVEMSKMMPAKPVRVMLTTFVCDVNSSNHKEPK